MATTLNFSGINSEGHAVQITVASEQNFEPEDNLDLALKQVALKAAKSSKDAQITVQVEQKDHSLSYNLAGLPQEIALANLDQAGVLTELAQSKIISAQAAPGLESLIDRFSEVNPRPRSTADKITQILAYFFEIIRVVYQYTSQLWGASPAKKNFYGLTWPFSPKSPNWERRRR